jgi:hypothetical protein
LRNRSDHAKDSAIVGWIGYCERGPRQSPAKATFRMRVLEPIMFGAPQIMGSLSECSRGVQFHLLVHGATVRLQTKLGVPIDQWTVASADQAFDFNPGKSVKAGMDVQAIQFTPSENGLLSAVVHVNGHPSPTDLAKGAFAKPLFECGECVWLFGLFAGADVTILNHGVDVLGKGVVRPDGQVEVHVKPPLKVGDDLTATQTACANVGGPVSSASPIAGGHPVPLDNLTFPQTQVHPVNRCATALYFEKVMDGASVTVTRTPVVGPSSIIGPRCLPVAPFSLWGLQAFEGNEVLVIETSLLTCKKPVGNKVKLVVDPNPPGPLVILNTICVGTPEIVLGNIELSALVEIAVNTPGNPVTLHFGASATQEGFSFSTGQPGAPVLAAGVHINVRQNLCGGPADWSTIASTIVQAAAPMPPKLVSPADHAVNTTLTPALTWLDAGTSPCSQANKFDVRVATTQAMFPADLVFAPNLSVSFTNIGIPAGILKSGTTYFWQVRAYHPGNTVPSAWSVIFQFTTKKDATGGGGGGGDQTFFFCQSCPGGFGPDKTITVTAPDFTTAEGLAGKNLPSGCFLNPGKCP